MEHLPRTADVDRFAAAHTQDVVLIADPTGCIQWISPSVERLLGWDPTHPQGRLSREFVHPDDLLVLADLQARSDAGETVEARVRVLHADGGYTWAALITEKLVDDAGVQTGRITAFRDVHAEVESRALLAQSEHHYRLLAENTAEFVTLAGADGRLEWASPTVQRILGWVPEEVYGRQVTTFVHPDDVPRLLELRGSMSADAPATLRARVQRSDGAYRWFDLTIRLVVEDGELVGRVTAYRDVQAIVETEAALQASELRYRMLAENATDVVVLAQDGVVAWVSPAIRTELGWAPEDWIGHRLESFTHPDDVAALTPPGSPAARSVRARLRLRSRDGLFHWVESHAGGFRDQDGALDGWLTAFRVIDDIVRVEQELDRRARFDALTGLINRHEAFDRLRVDERRSGHSRALLFCDLDRFKEINDNFGHAAGDDVLSSVATRLTECIRREDIAARIGGDELLVILDGVHDLDEAVGIAEHIRAAVSAPLLLSGAPGEVPLTLRLTVSIGVTLAHPAEDVDALVERADRAMYEAKAGGRDRVVAIAPPKRFDDEPTEDGSR